MNPPYDNKTVLLVDDDPDFLGIHRMQLETVGLKVVTAESEAEARAELDGFKPDLAVVDLMMENADSGFTLCYYIKRRYPDVPVILVSTVNDVTGMDFDAATEEQRAWIKADAFLGKPIRFEQLETELARLL